ncbi:hypothetical protein CYMTET_26271 [Cymbomonas tetramitiformis]|uniref:Tyrosine-protein kinase ephrin type A/B receptor-like domain-containing protein n=1 Tax=Cymbomonas tetramitiformis TaxID=36881 RepID=A0AAE0FS65_9CHLO|nr:hypothetical protein CYMTET_26271 [Cymbomonas tetramitiformis]
MFTTHASWKALNSAFRWQGGAHRRRFSVLWQRVAVLCLLLYGETALGSCSHRWWKFIVTEANSNGWECYLYELALFTTGQCCELDNRLVVQAFEAADGTTQTEAAFNGEIEASHSDALRTPEPCSETWIIMDLGDGAAAEVQELYLKQYGTGGNGLSGFDIQSCTTSSGTSSDCVWTTISSYTSGFIDEITFGPWDSICTEAATTSPSSSPTANPSAMPTSSPTTAPTTSPSSAPTANPSAMPTSSPTAAPPPHLSISNRQPVRHPPQAPPQPPPPHPPQLQLPTPSIHAHLKPHRGPHHLTLLSSTANPSAMHRSPTAATHLTLLSSNRQPVRMPTSSPTAAPTTSPSSSQPPTRPPCHLKPHRGPPPPHPPHLQTANPSAMPTSSPTAAPPPHPSLYLQPPRPPCPTASPTAPPPPHPLAPTANPSTTTHLKPHRSPNLSRYIHLLATPTPSNPRPHPLSISTSAASPTPPPGFAALPLTRSPQTVHATSVSFSFDGADVSEFTCQLDDGPRIHNCSSPHWATWLAVGNHTFVVNATLSHNSGYMAKEEHWEVAPRFLLEPELSHATVSARGSRTEYLTVVSALAGLRMTAADVYIERARAWDSDAEGEVCGTAMDPGAWDAAERGAAGSQGVGGMELYSTLGEDSIEVVLDTSTVNASSAAARRNLTVWMVVADSQAGYTSVVSAVVCVQVVPQSSLLLMPSGEVSTRSGQRYTGVVAGATPVPSSLWVVNAAEAATDGDDGAACVGSTTFQIIPLENQSWVWVEPANATLQRLGEVLDLRVVLPAVQTEAGTRSATFLVTNSGDASTQELLVRMTVIPDVISNQSVVEALPANGDDGVWHTGDSAQWIVRPYDTFGNAVTSGEDSSSVFLVDLFRTETAPATKQELDHSPQADFNSSVGTYTSQVARMTPYGRYLVYVRFVDKDETQLDLSELPDSNWTDPQGCQLTGSPLEYYFEPVWCDTAQHQTADADGLACTCMAGHFNNASGESPLECQACGLGWYGAEATSQGKEDACAQCEAGLTTLRADATSAGACVCSQGYYSHSGAATSECIPCTAGSYGSAANATSCVACPIGVVTPEEERVAECDMVCMGVEVAPKEGLVACQKCAANAQAWYFCEPEGSSAQEDPAQCVHLTGSPPYASACLCQSGYRSVSETATSSFTNQSCEPCAEGGVCAFGRMRGRDGYWRSDTSKSKFYRCSPPEVCLREEGALEGATEAILAEEEEEEAIAECRTGHGGVLCGGCSSGWRQDKEGNCSECEASINLVGMLALVAGAFALFLGYLQHPLYVTWELQTQFELVRGWSFRLMRRLQPISAVAWGRRTRVTEKGHLQLSSEAHEPAQARPGDKEGDREQGGAGDEDTMDGSLGGLRSKVRSQTSTATKVPYLGCRRGGSEMQQTAVHKARRQAGAGRDNQRAAKVIGKDTARSTAGSSAGLAAAKQQSTQVSSQLLKVALNFTQVLASFGDNFSAVPWPAGFLQLVKILDWLNIFTVDVPLVGCSDMGFIQTHALYVLAPILAIILLFKVATIHYTFHVAQCRTASREPKMDATRYKFFVIKSLLFVLFVSYIGLSARMLSYFNCTPVYEELYLTADLNIRCFAGLHAACLPLAVLGLLLYPIGVPATFVFLLVWYRVPQIARMKHSAYLLHLARQQLQDPGRCRELQDMDPIVGLQTVTVDELALLAATAEIRDGREATLPDGNVSSSSPSAEQAPAVLMVVGCESGDAGTPGKRGANAMEEGVMKEGGVQGGVGARASSGSGATPPPAPQPSPAHITESSERETSARDWAAMGREALISHLAAWVTRRHGDKQHAQRVYWSIDNLAEKTAGAGSMLVNVGQPLRSQLELWEANAQLRVGFIFRHYHVQAWWFEIYDLLRKLVLAGGIAFYGEGSSSQLLVAAAICFSAICINLSVRADAELAVHIFTTATNFVLLIILALALALLDDDSDAELIDQLLVWPILLVCLGFLLYVLHRSGLTAFLLRKLFGSGIRGTTMSRHLINPLHRLGSLPVIIRKNQWPQNRKESNVSLAMSVSSVEVQEQDGEAQNDSESRVLVNPLFMHVKRG